MKIGFIGTGNMGGALARAAAKGGHTLLLANRTPAKAAALAKELGPSGVTVNCVEPGVIDTDMNRGLDAGTRAELCGETPLCRMGTPADVSAAVLFFASPAADFITGQILGVDGGFAV